MCLPRAGPGGSGNQSIPSGIFAGLAVTTDLLLSRNALHTLNTSSFEGLSALEVLKLESNELGELPSDLFAHTKLKKLTLAHNRIAALHSSVFANMPLLEELDLSTNVLVQFPSDLSLTRLNKLTLAHNKLETLQPGAFSDFLSLEVLNVSSNAIADLPPTVFSGSAQLRSLDLSHNRLR